LKNVIVTGGSSGIGLATVQSLLDKGFKPVVLDCQKTDGLVALGVDYLHCDLVDANQIESSFQKIEKRYRSIYALINNAGILSYGNVEELTVDDWQKVMDINVRAPFLCAKYAIPLMNKGSIIMNVASIQSLFAQAKVAAYATSKAALLGLTRSIAIDYAGKVRCVAICPGTINTPMLHNALVQSDNPEAMMQELNNSHLTKRIGKAEEIAELITFLCGDGCQFINGTEIRVDGGLGVDLGGSID
jgi:NAD(P)-dependent dehydrogenase (short-subunit alcohol dehydrogenase family)